MTKRTEASDTSWGRCPTCDSDNLEGSSITIEDTAAIQGVFCMECGSEWDEVYAASYIIERTI